jgi:hypothetical protein
MFSDVTPEHWVRADHPLRPIRRLTDAGLARLSARFESTRKYNRSKWASAKWSKT